MTDLPVVLVWGLKATPLLFAAWLITAFLRRGSAAARHFVWVMATAGALALPLATVVAPRLAVRIPASLTSQPAAEPVGTDPAGPADASAVTAVTVATAATPVPSPGANPGAMSAPVSIMAWLTGLWAMGAGLMAMLVSLSLWRTARLGKRARPLSGGDLVRAVERGAQRIGIRRSVRVLEARGQIMPMTWGLVRPRILLPAGFDAWPAPRRQAVLLHELAHVRRWDWFTQLIARLAGTLYWWNPLMWVATRKLHEERELACDDLVLAQGTAASAYAADLLEIARAFRASPTMVIAAVAMARPSRLATRLRAVLDAARSRHSLAPGQALSGAAAAIALVVPIAGLVADADRLEPVPSTEEGVSIPIGTTILVAGSDPFPVSPPIRRPAGLAPQSRSALLCDWAAPSQRNSSSTNVDDDKMTIWISRGDCTITVRAEGKLTFADNDRDLTAISDEGDFEIEERADRTRRRVEIDAEGGQLERRWFVDGAEQAYGDDARAWLGDALLVLVRRAGINAEARAIRILSSQGEEALITEIAQLHTDHVASLYYRVLFARGALTPAQTSRLLTDAGRRIESDHALGRVLEIVATRQPMDTQVQRAYVAAADGLESDHEHSTALLALLAGGTPDVSTMDAVMRSAAQMESDHARSRVLTAAGLRYPPDRPLPPSYLSAVEGMDSDHERGQVLTALLKRDRLSAADRAQVLEVASQIDSDHTRSQVLLAVLADGPLDAATREPFFAAVKGMDSDYSCEQVLRGVLSGPADEANTLAVLDAARAISSDHSKAGVLGAVAAQGRMSERVRSEYMSVAQTIQSTYERERVMRAAGAQGT